MHLHGESLLGNEWIEYDKTYHRIDISEDGLYKITGSQLQANGATLNDGEKWQLWHMGEEIPIYVSDDDDFGLEDIIVFYGKKNRNGLDSLLFTNSSDQLSPRYSLFTDTSSYYLRSASGEVKRLENGSITLGVSGSSIPYYKRRFHIDSNQVAYNPYRRVSNQKIYNSEFNGTAGFGASPSNRYFQSVTLPDHVYNDTEEVKFGLQLAAFYLGIDDEIILRYQVSTNIFEEDTLKSFELVQKSFSLPAISSGNYTIAISRLNHASGRQFIVSNFWFEYLSSFRLTDDQIHYSFPTSNQNITLQNVSAGSEYYISDIDNNTFSIFTPSTDTIQYAHENSEGNYIVEKLDNIAEISTFKQVDFIEGTPRNSYSFTIVTSKQLYEQSPSPNSIDDYIAYRSSVDGGEFNVQLHFIEDLYDRFAYGIQRHPLALNNFSEQLRQEDDKGHLLIIGKGRAYTLVRTPDALSSPANQSFYVPTFGFPASDALLTAPLGQITPRLSFGRLAVSNLNEVAVYLNNVMQFEQLAPEVPSVDPNWKKEVIHLSGGNELANAVRLIFNRMSATFQKTDYAPNITTFYKNGTVTVDSSLSDQIYSKINRGASIVSFYGHSAPNTLGFKIDNQSKYANGPILPLFIALGCSAGNYNISDESVAETYCLMENKGFLNLFSSTTISRVFDLEAVGHNIYNLIGNHADSLTIGELTQLTIAKTISKSRRQASQLSLFGDPTIRLNIPTEVDLTIEKQSISTTPDFLSAELDSFDFEFNIISHGRSPQLHVPVKVIRQFPTGHLEVIFDEDVAIDGFKTNIQLTVALESNMAAGSNRLQIEIDDRNIIEELLYPNSELNNSYIHSDGQAGFPIFIPSNSTIPLWPRDKSIVPSTTISLLCSTGDLLGPASEFYIELDTSILFYGPMYTRESLSSTGGLIEFNPAYSFASDQVYYWRVSPSPDPISGEFYWSEPQSFIIIPEKEGWNISHYYQFLDTYKEGLEINPSRKWEFNKNYIPIRFSNGLWESDNQDQLGWFEFNGPFPKTTALAWEVEEPALAIIAFDHDDNRLENPRGGSNGSIPVNKDKDYFAFENTQAGRDSLMHFIQHVIPNHYHILFYTVRNSELDLINSSNWALDSVRNDGVNIFNLLEGYGATSVRNIQSSQRVNYLSHFIKSDGHLFEEISFDDTKVLTNDFNLLDWETYGTISLDNEIIELNDRTLLKWSIDAMVDSSDSYDIYYQRIDNSNKVYIQNNVISGSQSINTLPDSIRNSAIFWSDVSDDHLLNPTPAQPQYYRMYGQLIGDFALAPNLLWNSPNPTYQASEMFSGSIAVANINHKETTLPYLITARNVENNDLIQLAQSTLDIPKNEQSKIDFNGLLEVPGEYILTIQLNPKEEIIEGNYFNNTIQFPITILGDKSNPLLNVLFDGQSIFNGQIVSPTSEISIKLTDDNKFTLLNSADLITASIQQPDGSAWSITPGLNASYTFPQLGDENTMELLINGNFEQEGTYHLEAFGRDVAGNANQVAYKVDFQVFHKIGVGVRAHPNPVIERLLIDYVLFGETQEGAQLYVTNAIGKTVLVTDLTLVEGQHQHFINIPSEWPTGMYQYQLVIKTINGEEYSEYEDESLGFKKGGRTGQFLLLRSQ